MTLDIMLVLIVLAIAIFLFISKFFRIDIIAILVMVTLPWLGLIKTEQIFAGFASNAVITTIAVMILAYGLDRSGLINRIIKPIVKTSGSNEKRLIVLISITSGIASAFMPNIGAVALFLPAMLRITKTTDISASHLLMPMAFSTLLGGTLSMVGSSPLLILNDLLKHTGQKEFSLFTVTPVGVALLAAGVLYFFFLGKYILPGATSINKKSTGMQQQLIETWSLPTTIFHCTIPAKSPLISKTRSIIKMRTKYKLNLLAIAEGKDIFYAPWRHTPFAAGQTIALLGRKDDYEQFVSDFKLTHIKSRKIFQRLKTPSQAGFAELIIPVKSQLAGKTLRQIELRKSYGVEPVILLSGSKEDRGAFSDQILNAGNTIIVHGLWERIKAMADNINFVLVTPVETKADLDESKTLTAVSCFTGALILVLAGFPISLGFLTGALAMILFNVIPIDEAYKAIDWKTVFLLSGLIPLGIAMDQTGTAHYIATHMMTVLNGAHPVIILSAVALLSSFFALFMSNVTATVILVPFMMMVGDMSGINPRALALLVALCASNAFMLPIHQVNALIISPGGYDNRDFLKAGSIMTLIYIIISVTFIYLFYL
ncbi:MAG: SLC13 family permease [Spirochaetes bacterium]|nr:SLC13 family permease [Spirochaetota bacterium]